MNCFLASENYHTDKSELNPTSRHVFTNATSWGEHRKR